MIKWVEWCLFFCCCYCCCCCRSIWRFVQISWHTESLCAVCMRLFFISFVSLSFNTSIQLSHSVKVNFGIFDWPSKIVLHSHTHSIQHHQMIQSIKIPSCCVSFFSSVGFSCLLLLTHKHTHTHILPSCTLKTLSYLEINLLTKPPSDYVL